MRWRALITVGLVLVAMAAVPAFAPGLVWRDAPAIALTGDASRGAYVYRFSGCGGCHSPPGHQSTEIAVPSGGLALQTPFGVFHVPGLTPAQLTGWSVDDLARALRLGLSPDGRHYYPAFPYPFYASLTDQDVADLYAFLMAQPATANPTPAHALHFPFGLRPGLAFWKLAFLGKPAPFSTDPVLARGDYLARAGHCGACHTPLTPWGAFDNTRFMAGTAKGVDGKAVPNLTPHPHGLGDWTEDDILAALKQGLTPEGDVLAREMAAVVRENTRHLRPDDLRALVAWLRALPPLANTP